MTAFAAGALVAIVSLPVFAADTGGYVLASFGATNFSSFDPDPQLGPGDSIKKSSTGLKLGGGMMFTPNFGAEAGYANLGKAVITFAGYGDVDVKATGLFVAAVGAMPVSNEVSIFGRLGVLSGSLAMDGPGFSHKSKGVKPMYGIGGQYNVSRQLGVRAEFEALQVGKKGDANDPNNDDALAKIRYISVGVVYRFN